MPTSELLEQCLYFFETILHPIMLVGVHGIGKSSIVEQYAAYKNLEFYNIRASLISEVDVLGYPITNQETLQWLPPYWLKAACDRPCLIIFDELNRAKEVVRNCLFQLTDSRRIGANVLHPQTRIFAAINPDTDKYFVNPLDAPELDRWYLMDFAPDANIWLAWANENKVNHLITSYITTFPDQLDPAPDADIKLKGTSRRSWTRLSDALNTRYPTTEKELQALVHGFLGAESGQLFVKYCKLHHQSGNDYVGKIRDGSITLPELGHCFKIGDDFWKNIYSENLLAELLYNVSGIGSMEFFDVFKESLMNITNETLYKQIVNHKYQKGFGTVTFSQDLKEEEDSLAMNLEN